MESASGQKESEEDINETDGKKESCVNENTEGDSPRRRRSFSYPEVPTTQLSISLRSSKGSAQSKQNNARFTKITARSPAPDERYGHTAEVDVMRGRMYLFGGCNSSSYLSSELFKYSFEDKQWVLIGGMGMSAGNMNSGVGSPPFSSSSLHHYNSGSPSLSPSTSPPMSPPVLRHTSPLRQLNETEPTVSFNASSSSIPIPTATIMSQDHPASRAISASPPPTNSPNHHLPIDQMARTNSYGENHHHGISHGHAISPLHSPIISPRSNPDENASEGEHNDNLPIAHAVGNAYTRPSSPPMAPPWPLGRHFHSSCLWNNAMYIFGGKCNAYLNDLWKFDFYSERWQEIIPEDGIRPSKRYGQGACVHGSAMYIYGGYDELGMSCSDLWKFDFSKSKWQRMQTLRNPPERYHHSVVLANGSMYVFGGYRCESSSVLEFRFSTNTWGEIITTGIPPTPRWGHICALFDDHLYILGGCDSVLNFDGLFRLSLRSGRWEQLSNYEECPPQGYFRSAAVYDGAMYIFGGKNIHNYKFNDLYQYKFEGAEHMDPEDMFVSDMKSLLYGADHADIVFMFGSESRKLHAHQFIITARCSRLRELIVRAKSLLSATSAASTCTTNTSVSSLSPSCVTNIANANSNSSSSSSVPSTHTKISPDIATVVNCTVSSLSLAISNATEKSKEYVEIRTDAPNTLISKSSHEESDIPLCVELGNHSALASNNSGPMSSTLHVYPTPSLSPNSSLTQLDSGNSASIAISSLSLSQYDEISGLPSVISTSPPSSSAHHHQQHPARRRSHSKERKKKMKRKESGGTLQLGTISYSLGDLVDPHYISSTTTMQNTRILAVEVKDVSSNTFQHLLEYLYTGNTGSGGVAFSTNEAEQLMELAHAYKVNHLQNICANSLRDKLEEVNVVRLLCLAHRCNAVSFKQYCLSYLLDHLKGVGPQLRQSNSITPALMKEIKMELSRRNAEKATGGELSKSPPRRATKY